MSTRRGLMSAALRLGVATTKCAGSPANLIGMPLIADGRSDQGGEMASFGEV